MAVTSGFAAETRLDQVELFNDDCQFTMLPVLPERVIDVPVPLQTVFVVGVAVPPTEVGLTVAVVVAPVEVQPATVTVTVYEPLAAVVAPEIDGFCEPELKLFGPVQL